MLWWKVEVTEAGEVIRCTTVEAEAQGSATVLYIEGETADAAIDQALARYQRAAVLRYERAKAQRNASTKRLQERRRRAGKCRSCTNKLAPDSKKFCPAHLQQARDYMREYASRPKRTRAKVDPAIAEERRAQQHRRYCAMRVLLPTLLAKFDELDHDRPWSRFREWLLLEISARSGAPGNDVAQAAE